MNESMFKSSKSFSRWHSELWWLERGLTDTQLRRALLHLLTTWWPLLSLLARFKICRLLHPILLILNSDLSRLLSRYATLFSLKSKRHRLSQLLIVKQNRVYSWTLTKPWHLSCSKWFSWMLTTGTDRPWCTELSFQRSNLSMHRTLSFAPVRQYFWRCVQLLNLETPIRSKRLWAPPMPQCFEWWLIGVDQGVLLLFSFLR